MKGNLEIHEKTYEVMILKISLPTSLGIEHCLCKTSIAPTKVRLLLIIGKQNVGAFSDHELMLLRYFTLEK